MLTLKRSFCPMGITTSLTSGLPRRETWTYAPDSFLTPPSLPSRTVTLGASVSLHTPMTGLRTGSPLSATAVFGTESTTVLTL